ncbi:hypothetical protein [Kitasatospora sp. NPDC004272]
MGIVQDQMPPTPQTMWQAIRQLQRQGVERAARLMSVLRRQDSSVAATLGTSWAWMDLAGTTVVSEDAVAGTGLARPYIPMMPAPARYTDWLASTSSTFEDIHRFTIKKHQAYAYISLGYTSDLAGTTGTVQVTVNGTVTGSLPVTFLIAAATIGPFVLPGPLLGQVEIRVQAQRTAGTGAVRCAVLAASQIQA